MSSDPSDPVKIKKIKTGLVCCPTCGAQWKTGEAPNYCPDCGESPMVVKGFEFTYADGTKHTFMISFGAFDMMKKKERVKT